MPEWTNGAGSRPQEIPARLRPFAGSNPAPCIESMKKVLTEAKKESIEIVRKKD